MYQPGQRWLSEAEPELGLGIVIELSPAVNPKMVQLSFPASGEARNYGIKTAPLKRMLFRVGDTITSHEGVVIEVASVEERDGLYFYQAESGEELCEAELDDRTAFHRPEERIFSGAVDTERLYNLRTRALDIKRHVSLNPYRGLQGARMALIPHQLYVASSVCARPFPRVLLADEVGLGKTVEAGLVLHNLLLRSRVSRVLIIVPDSLVYQWFVEMLRRFNLSFAVVNQEMRLEEGTNPFKDNELVLLGLGLLKGSKVARDLLAEAEFDLLIVDEAHHIKWSQKEQSLEFEILYKLSQEIPGLLLLTATPEQRGSEGHFARLHLLDPDKFPSFDSFLKLQRQFEATSELGELILAGSPLPSHWKEQYPALTPLVNDSGTVADDKKEDALRLLVDLYGTGRMYYRNARKKMDADYGFFPKRVLHRYPIDLDEVVEGANDDEGVGKGLEYKAAWVLDFLSSNPDRKVLLITRSKSRVLFLERFLKENGVGIGVGVFHSDLGLMARDRQAAYFADPKGAQILLCTEIGSEGRNFEFASHLVLFDLPLKPDLLEQRIGRLDRIGQKFDVNIHVPFIKGSWEQTLLDWYDQGLDLFSAPQGSGNFLFGEFKDELRPLLESNSPLSAELLEKTVARKRELDAQLEKGRDHLIEWNSFNREKASVIQKAIRAEDESRKLRSFMDQVFSELGVDVDDLDGTVLYVRPGDNMYLPFFPELPPDGIRITFDRSTALSREDVTLMTWDHPMVMGILDIISNGELGNATVATRKSAGKKTTFLEAYFMAEAIGERDLELERFFAPLPIRVLVDKEGADLSEKWDAETLNSKIEEAGREVLASLMKLSRDALMPYLEAAKSTAAAKLQVATQEALSLAKNHFESELTRIKNLEELVGEDLSYETEWMEDHYKRVLAALGSITLGLDSMRLIV